VSREFVRRHLRELRILGELRGRHCELHQLHRLRRAKCNDLQLCVGLPVSARLLQRHVLRQRRVLQGCVLQQRPGLLQRQLLPTELHRL
jgi:hypothetical protein